MMKQRKGTGLREGAVRLMATDLGIDSDLAAKAGPAAAKVLGALSDAGACDCPGEKADGIRRAQKHLRNIDPARHGALVQQLQARLLAAQGRGGDTEVAHLTPGELVVPPQLQTPELMTLLQETAAARGIGLSRLFVGHAGNSVNPGTGQPEFNIADDYKNWKIDPPRIEEITVTGRMPDRFGRGWSGWGPGGYPGILRPIYVSLPREGTMPNIKPDLDIPPIEPPASEGIQVQILLEKYNSGQLSAGDLLDAIHTTTGIRFMSPKEVIKHFNIVPPVIRTPPVDVSNPWD